MTMRRYLFAALFVAAAATLHAQVREADDIVTHDDLLTTVISDNWPSYNGDYTGRRYSSLTQITPANAHQLAAQWVFHSRNAGILEATPLVVDGIMYVTGSNDAYALDATTGKTIWHYVRPVTQGLIERLTEDELAMNPAYSPEVIRKNAVVGTADEVIARLKHCESLGYDEYSMWIDTGMSFERKRQSLQRLIDDVMPAFA